MKASDSEELKTALSALRKLYRRISRQAENLHPELSSLQVLAIILLAETERRSDLDSAFEHFNRIFKLSLEAQVLDAWQSASTFCSGDKSNVKANDKSNQIAQTIKSELNKNAALLNQFDESFAGYFYQFSCEEARRQALDRIQSADKKSGKEDLIYFTQLYTPAWVADYLSANVVLPHWAGSPDQSWLDRHSPWFKQGKSGDLQVSELRIIDPACGAGHLLLAVFDLLMQLYLQEGKTREFAANQILSSNLYGCDLDSNALWVCALALQLKAWNNCKDPGSKLNLVDVSNHNPGSDTPDFERGSLDKSWHDKHPLSRQYHAVISNPPYIGRRLLDRRLKQFLKASYPSAHDDISAAFLVRSLELCVPGGRVGFITQSSLLYLPSYGDLRKSLIDNENLYSVVELGTRVFPLVAGEKINSMLIVLNKEHDGSKQNASPKNGSLKNGPIQNKEESRRYPVFLDLTKSTRKSSALLSALEKGRNGSNGSGRDNDDAFEYIERNTRDFLRNREYAFNYKCPEVLSKILKDAAKIGETAEIKQGMATTDNNRFVRYFWDVDPSEIGNRWHPYVKGAGSERWHASCQAVVDWEDGGRKIKAAVEESYPYLKGRVAWVVKNEQYYFRRGLTFSFVSTGLFAVRRLPAGAIFDVGGSALFCNEVDESVLLAYLNSSFAAICVELLNPTFNFQVGDIKQVPLPKFSQDKKDRLISLAEEAFALKSSLNSYDETQIFYHAGAEVSAILAGADPQAHWLSLKSNQERICSRLLQIEDELDVLIFDAIKDSYAASSSDLIYLDKLIKEKIAARKPAQSYYSKPGDFAASLLRSCIDASASISPDAAQCTSLTLPFENELPQLCRGWLEKHLSMNLSQYFQSEFNRVQLKVFHGSPKYISIADGQNDQLLLFSNQATRRILSKGSSVQLQSSEYGYKILSQVQQRLNGIDDWTGKQLYQAIY